MVTSKESAMREVYIQSRDEIFDISDLVATLDDILDENDPLGARRLIQKSVESLLAFNP